MSRLSAFPHGAGLHAQAAEGLVFPRCVQNDLSALFHIISISSDRAGWAQGMVFNMWISRSIRFRQDGHEAGAGKYSEIRLENHVEYASESLDAHRVFTRGFEWKERFVAKNHACCNALFMFYSLTKSRNLM